MDEEQEVVLHYGVFNRKAKQRHPLPPLRIRGQERQNFTETKSSLLELLLPGNISTRGKGCPV